MSTALEKVEFLCNKILTALGSGQKVFVVEEHTVIADESDNIDRY